MANYADGLTDLNLPDYVQEFQESDKVGAFLAVQPPQSFHVISIADDGDVKDIRTAQDAEIWINGIFRQAIFDYIRNGEELVEAPFRRLIAANKLMARRHSSFWACMDTFKEKKMFDEMVARGHMPWAAWDNAPAANLRPLNAINARVMDFSGARSAHA